MHRRGSQANAPVSDAAGRGRDAADRASVSRRATWRFPNRADAAEIGTDAAEIGSVATEIGPTRSVSTVSACIGRIGLYRPKRPSQAEIQKKKKKKKVQTHRSSLTPSLISLAKEPCKSRVHNYISLWKIP